jgi:hypothetical protein
MKNNTSNTQDSSGSALKAIKGGGDALTTEAPSVVDRSEQEILKLRRMISDSELRLRELDNQLQLQRHQSLRHAVRETELDEALHVARSEITRLRDLTEAYQARIAQIEGSRFYKLMQSYAKAYERPVIGTALRVLRRMAGPLLRMLR